ncbi:leukocyte immunoglobulin-like receptor subfamily A member 5 isoform X2 [Eleutherodactylus coqui]|uniref:leukocyte immunoglobulin-like receptor subfamily A member 5 isoform X2 n=1 Tax=Eleutherodactylus coqui TaxID=57060 RepID=UPI0034619F5B
MQETNVAMSSHPFTIYFYILLPALHLAWGDKAEIRAFPSKVVKKGDDVTIRCSGPYNQGAFRLQRTNTDYSDSKDKDGKEYNFTVTDVQEDNSAYRCAQYSGSWWSERSDPLTLQVIDPQKPNISCVQDNSDDTKLRITCSAPDPPEGCRVKRFHLYSGRERIKDLNVKESFPQVIFGVSNPSEKYRCYYVVEVKEEPNQLIEAPFSDEVTATECKGAAEEKQRDYTRGNTIRISVAGALLVMIIVVVSEYCYREKKRTAEDN